MKTVTYRRRLNRDNGGQYEGYGQQLEVNAASLKVPKGAPNNPNLNVRALRKACWSGLALR